MVIRYSKHAERRLIERAISKTWIETTIADPDRQFPDPRDARLTRAYKKLSAAGGRVLRVIYTTVGDDILIVTAFLDRDVE
jgi:ribosomal protein S12 methylthiotransferase accessory factor YcaO